MDQELIRAFLNKKNIFAVVGASRDPKNMVTRYIGI